MRFGDPGGEVESPARDAAVRRLRVFHRAWPETLQVSAFFDEFSALLLSAGGPERSQLLDFMPRARRILLNNELTSAVYDALNEAPSSIELNMDLIAAPADDVLWIELDGYARRLASERTGAAHGQDDRVGYLVMRHQSDPDVLVCAVARKSPDRVDGACYLMPAFCAISLPELAEFSGASRRYFDRGRQSSQGRMIMMVRAYMPPGIAAEIREMGKAAKAFDEQQVQLAARRESAPEGVFLLAVLMALSASNVEQAGGFASLTGAPAPYRHRLSGILGLRTPETGFLRTRDDLHLLSCDLRPAAPAVAA